MQELKKLEQDYEEAFRAFMYEENPLEFMRRDADVERTMKALRKYRKQLAAKVAFFERVREEAEFIKEHNRI